MLTAIPCSHGRPIPPRPCRGHPDYPVLHVRLVSISHLSYSRPPVCCSRLVLDLSFQNIPTARPAIEVGLLYVLTIFWLGENPVSVAGTPTNIP